MLDTRRGYYAAMRALCADKRDDVLADCAMLWSERRKLTPADLIQLAIWHGMKPAEVAWILEDLGVLPCGSYDAMKRRGFQPMKALREAQGDA